MAFDGLDAFAHPFAVKAAADWGTGTFNGCDWCRRGRDTPQPITRLKLMGYPTLCFKSDRICNSCTSTLKNTSPETMGKGCKQKKNAKLKAKLC